MVELPHKIQSLVFFLLASVFSELFLICLYALSDSSAGYLALQKANYLVNRGLYIPLGALV